MGNRGYSQKEDLAIIRMRTAGKKNYEIASELGRSLDSVKGRIKFLIKRDLIKSRGAGIDRYPEGRIIRKWSEKELERLRELRLTGWPYKSIAEELDRSVDAIQQMCIKLMKNDDTLTSRNQPKDTKVYDLNSELAKIGLMLWWAEGTKGGNSVQFVNTSKDMIRLYMRFLHEIGVDIGRVKAKVKVMNSSQIEECQNYWSELTDIPIENFTRPIVRGKEVDESHKDHKGCLTITYCSKNLKRQMEAKIEEITDNILNR